MRNGDSAQATKAKESKINQQEQPTKPPSRSIVYTILGLESN